MVFWVIAPFCLLAVQAYQILEEHDFFVFRDGVRHNLPLKPIQTTHFLFHGRMTATCSAIDYFAALRRTIIDTISGMWRLRLNRVYIHVCSSTTLKQCGRVYDVCSRLFVTHQVHELASVLGYSIVTFHTVYILNTRGNIHDKLEFT